METVLLGFCCVAFFAAGLVSGHFMTFFSAYDWETKYKQWKKDNGYDD